MRGCGDWVATTPCNPGRAGPALGSDLSRGGAGSTIKPGFSTPGRDPILAGRLRRLEMMLDPTRTYRTRAARRNPSTGFAARMESVEPRLLFATFTVTTTADAGPGSFRQAILDANAAPNPADDVDFINFNIPGTG